jgi:hypothetical protein
MTVGGFSTISTNDAGVQEAAKFAIQELNRRSNSMYTQTLAGVKSAKQQVVAGINYELILAVGGSPNGNARDVKVRIWKKLDGSYSLVSHE